MKPEEESSAGETLKSPSTTNMPDFEVMLSIAYVLEEETCPLLGQNKMAKVNRRPSIVPFKIEMGFGGQAPISR